MVLIIIVVTVFVLGFAGVAFVAYRRVLRRAKNIERGLKMVPLLIHLPPPSADTESSGRDVREVMREKISQGEVLYNLLAGTAAPGLKSQFYGQRHIALELVASKGLIHFYAAVPVVLVPVVINAINTAYPGAKIEEAEDHNLFNPTGKLDATLGGELVLKTDSAYPIASVDQLERDPLEGLLNAIGDLDEGSGVGVQIMLRPANPTWSRHSIGLVRKKRREAGQKTTSSYTSRDLMMAPFKAPEQRRQEVAQHSPQALYMSDLEQSVVKAIEDKTRMPAFETLVRIVVASPQRERSEELMRQVSASFSLFDAPGLNGFKYLPATDVAGLVTAFILRFFPPELNQTILNSQELATLFHLPDAQFTPISAVERQASKQVDGPVSVPTSGLLLGYNFYRGTKKEIRLSAEDRRRHTYVVGQTGTGKSTLLENLAVQDMLAGNGFAFIDPHGDTAERLLSMVPKNRAEDIIYFNPADTQYPLGLNIFEFQTPEQKDFLIQEAIGMLYKLYDPGHTGIIGPRYEHWFRNAALTLMSDPAGATFIEIPKVFTDTDYLKSKFKYLTDQTVIDFWTQEMAQTSDYHKSEMLGWFVSKFGAFQQNEIMRNIIGQPKSAFNLRDVMDNKKILIVNLSKGNIGELNSQLLGMIFVIKIQAAAMSRANLNEADRADFCLYVDEFQNFSTDSFASILSEARKYHLNLIVANQFIGQLTDQLRDAVFGNVGTIMSYRTGPEDAEFLVKQFAPVFDAHDLVNIPNHNAVIRLMIGGLPSQPFSLTALPPLGVANPELGAAVKQLSAAKFGVNKAQVEQAIFARLASQPAAPVISHLPAGVAAATSQPVAPAVAPPEPPPLVPLTPPAPSPAQPLAAPQPPSVDAFTTMPQIPTTQPAPIPVPPPPSSPPSPSAPADLAELPDVPMAIPMPKPAEVLSRPVVADSPLPPAVPGDSFHVPVDPTQELAEYAFALDHNQINPSRGAVPPPPPTPDPRRISVSPPVPPQASTAAQAATALPTPRPTPEPVKVSPLPEPPAPEPLAKVIETLSADIKVPVAPTPPQVRPALTPPTPLPAPNPPKPVEPPVSSRPQPNPQPLTPIPKLAELPVRQPAPEPEVREATTIAPPVSPAAEAKKPTVAELVAVATHAPVPVASHPAPLAPPTGEIKTPIPPAAAPQPLPSKPIPTPVSQAPTLPDPPALETKPAPPVPAVPKPDINALLGVKAPEPETPAKAPGSAVAPTVAAGEVFVDADGNVIQG